jgi:GTPase
MDSKKAGYVTIIGKPNSGKSTLLNAILGQNLSIVTPKPQTTRYKTIGIYTNENIQMVFVDTPGILKPKYKLQSFMKKEIESSFVDADVILLLIDASKYTVGDLEELTEKYRNEFSKHKLFCVINKIDLITSGHVLMMIGDISKKFDFNEIIPISAISAYNVDRLIQTIIEYLPDSEFYYDGSQLTTQPEKFFVSEIIRENALIMYGEEIPYSIYVEIDEFKEREKGKDYVRASIIVEKDSQKKIVIGREGVMIRKLGESARVEIEQFIGRSVYLELHVKVRKNWKNDESFLKKKYYAANR